ncbi:hypothetical protein L249_2053 [Ophiocordyceps polyrhachis-furcata BCC 54312]|uniref:DUF4048 domain-containing protein n=1 Tax=Ophiocordyceps polyrhachis-furcata BCC 54312 TaxID=1330021 RepID=A0A367LMW9_9HYPO|nr:hypothetical protein L249_2053 [Ophiocordyceps polyrhachis-furcata BCC 54312]
MTAFLLRLCFINKLSHSLPDDYRHFTQAHYKTLAARAARQRLRRAIRASSTRSLHTRRRRHGSQSFQSPLRIRGLIQHSPGPSSSAITTAVGAIEPSPSAIMNSSSHDTHCSSTDQCQPESAPDTPQACHRKQQPADDATSKTDGTARLSPTEPGRCLHRSRPVSVASRAFNRLSLTIPIAPPTSGPSRPTPASGAPPPIPPAAVETPKLPLSSDANDFIIAVAAQERRVLELREELARAEAELALLKSRWSEEPRATKGPAQAPDMPGSATSDMADEVSLASRRSAELDRRKFLLQSQSVTHDTPQGNRRKVIRGGHARTLSLLSPSRLSSEISLPGNNVLGATDPRPVQAAAHPAQLKRASWQPRSVQSSPTVPQIVEDFKLGLRAFVDDLRQITVGDEPVRVTPTSRGPALASRRGSAGGPERLRSGLASVSQTNTPSPAMASPMPDNRILAAARIERPKPVKSKPFSWTPLGFDSMDDSDWSNWESPSVSKTTRWSGSTVNSGGGSEEIGSIPEVREDGLSPEKSRAGSKVRLEEMLPDMVNRVSSNNFKRRTSGWMDEWEKSLVVPDPDDQENQGPATTT